MRYAERSQADRFVTHVCIQRHRVLPRIRHARASQFSLDVGLAVGSSLDRSVEAVLRDPRAIYILVEEPVHLVVAVQIHAAGHVLFDDGFEVFGGGRLVIERLAVVLHHVLEEMLGIGVARIHKLQMKHVQHIGALRVDQVLIRSGPGCGRSDPPAHPNRPERFNHVAMEVFVVK